ncbi:MAG: hypothetical protein IT434_15605 [Phycisphaerales bacterium]|jgi:sugar-specific transcriptional regulator TrmB|nr:hypothetical protein [Phycisphaerales bacterium]
MPRRHSPSPAPDLATSLLELGLTPAEAEVYAFLLSESPATGYRVAQAIGRPVGNVYKAVEALEAKGAALVADDEDHRVARAIPLTQFAAQARARVQRACDAAQAAAQTAAALAVDNAADFDDRLYRLNNADQFIARAHALTDDAAMFILALGAPAAFEPIADALVAAAARGIPVAIKSLVPIDLPGVRVIVDHRGETALFNAPGHWLSLNADGGQVLEAMLDAETSEVLTGYWTRHPLIAWTSYTGLYSRLILEELRAADEPSLAPRRGDPRWAPFEHPLSEGKRLMVERFRTPSPGARRSARKKREGDDS